MAKADFTRSIITNTIKVAEVKVDNGAVITTELLPIVKVGTAKLSPEKALKIAKAEYKKRYGRCSSRNRQRRRGQGNEFRDLHGV